VIEKVIGQSSSVIREENEDAASSLDSDILILVSLTGRASRPRGADYSKNPLFLQFLTQ
jgi:hypothetical protein